MRQFNIKSDYNAIRSLFDYEVINNYPVYSASVSEALSAINWAYYEGSDIIASKDDIACTFIIETIGNYLTENQIKHDILFNEQYNGFELFLY